MMDTKLTTEQLRIWLDRPSPPKQPPEPEPEPEQPTEPDEVDPLAEAGHA
jgi:hypothetical protein